MAASLLVLSRAAPVAETVPSRASLQRRGGTHRRWGTTIGRFYWREKPLWAQSSEAATGYIRPTADIHVRGSGEAEFGHDVHTRELPE